MKIYSAILLVFAVALTSCHSITRSETKSAPAGDSLLEEWQKPVALGPSEKEITQLIETVKPIREELIRTIDELYPGLYKKYEADAKQMSSLHRSTEIERKMAEMDSRYKKQFMNAYVKSGIDDRLKDMYRSILSKYSYVVGDLGTLRITTSRQIMGALLSDSTVDVACPFDVKETNSNCNDLAANEVTLVRDCSAFAGSDVNFMDGCRVTTKLGKNIKVSSTYRAITSTFNADYVLIAIAVAGAGGTYCNAIVGSEIDEGNAVKVKNEFSKIWAVAPLTWLSSASESGTNQNFICSYNHKPGSGPAFTATPKIYCETNSGTSVVAGGKPDAEITNISSLKLQVQE